MWSCAVRRRHSSAGANPARQLSAEQTDHPREVIDAALVHVVPNKVEAAYARSDLFERRRLLMNDWAGRLGEDVDDSTRR